MKKIPTVFRRDPDDMRYVTGEVNPECQWVLDGEGVATRKYDGTCVMLDDDGQWWAPIEQSSFVKAHADALVLNHGHTWSPGTYELIGPKINGNPEGYERHDLIRHANAESLVRLPGPRTPENVRTEATSHGWEGVVWHHPDGRMAKLKARDFPRVAVIRARGAEEEA